MERFTGVVLVAAGSGERFGGPKAFVELGGRPLVEHSAALFERFGFQDRVVVLPRTGRGLPGWKRVEGGARRRDSVAAGLDALDPETKSVLVHDAARPLTPPAVVERVLAALAEHAAVVPGIPVADTIKRVEAGRVAGTPDRSSLVAVQTPQGFRIDLLRRALATLSEDATDEAALVEALGEDVFVVAGDPRALKVTRPLDLEIAEILLSKPELR